MRKEPIVFLVFAACLGWQMKGLVGAKPKVDRTKSRSKEYVGASLPDVSLAMAETSRAVTFERDLFAPPSATTPLPPLNVVLPPLEPLSALAPPTGWGPMPSSFGRLLRQPAKPANANELPGLFNLGAANDVDANAEDSEAVVDLEELPDDPDARAARIAGFKKQYDWILSGRHRFGRIQNEDRYELRPANDPEIVFIELNPATGVPIVNASITFTPDMYDEFGLVDNPLTFVETGFASFKDPLAVPSFDDALSFADQCLLLRNETPRALEIAAELFRRAQAINSQDDARPRLGLARTMELGFHLEEAFNVYQDLLTTGHESNPVVHARLGQLYSNLRMDDAALDQFEEALSLGRTNWEARLRMGEFLVSRGQAKEALPHLKEAVLREPKSPEQKSWRVRIRLANAGALLRAGQPDEAFDAFSSAMSADQANEVGMMGVAEAGKLSAARLSSQPAATAFIQEKGESDVIDGRFDVLLAEGLLAMDQGRFEASAQALKLAASADPFRSFEALRAQSRLAEITGNPEDAVSFAQDAFAANPTDPWTLYQLGRLAEAAGDTSEARAAYRAALDLELDLAPALERMAVLLHDAEEHEAAERYYERTVTIEPDSAAVWARRGWNALSLDQVDIAKTCLDEARRLSPALASARAGLAWWNYAVGETDESIVRLGEIVDDRRAIGEDDPMVTFAIAQADRIRDHVEKEVFRDRFDRANGRLGNGWSIDQGFGPLAELADGAVEITGNQDRGGRTRVFRQLTPDRFLAMSMELTVGADAKGTRAGLFISSERTAPGGSIETMSEITISRSRDGDLQVRVLRTPTDENSSQRTVTGPEWPIGQPIRVAIERSGEDLESRYTLYVDGEPVQDGLEADRLTASRKEISFGVFVEGEAGRRADVKIDNVRVVRRR